MRLVSFREACGPQIYKSSQQATEHNVDLTFLHAFDLNSVGSRLPAGT